MTLRFNENDTNIANGILKLDANAKVTLDKLDTTTSAPTSGQLLKYNGTNWAPGNVTGSNFTWPTAALNTGANTLSVGNYYYTASNGITCTVTLPSTGNSGDIIYIHNMGGSSVTTNALQYYWNGAYFNGQTFAFTANDVFVFTRLNTSNAWLISTQVSQNLRITTNISEGTNLYFTDERAQDASASLLTSGTHTGISFTYTSTQDTANRIDATVSLGIDALTDVDTTTVAPTNGQALAWQSATSKWIPQTVSGAGGGSGLVFHTNVTTNNTILNPPSGETMVLVKNGSTAFNVYLPAMLGKDTYKIHIKRLGTAYVTVNVNASDTTKYIESSGNSTFVLSITGTCLTLVANETDGIWYIV